MFILFSLIECTIRFYMIMFPITNHHSCCMLGFAENARNGYKENKKENRT